MTICEINNKMSSDFCDGNEDLLTSDVFGTMKYLSVNTLLLPFLDKSLRSSQSPNSAYAMLQSNEGWKTFREKVDSAKYFFWPRMKTNCEPDLIVNLYDKQQKQLACILIENKYYSSKSDSVSKDYNAAKSDGKSGDDQLVKYWKCMVEGGPCNQSKDYFTIPSGQSVFKILIYVTSHSSLPDELRESEKIAAEEGVGPLFYWNSWPTAYSTVDCALTNPHLSITERGLLSDLSLLLTKKGFKTFTGWSGAEAIASKIGSEFLSVLPGVFVQPAYFDYIEFFQLSFADWISIERRPSIFWKGD